MIKRTALLMVSEVQKSETRKLLEYPQLPLEDGAEITFNHPTQAIDIPDHKMFTFALEQLPKNVLLLEANKHPSPNDPYLE